MQRAPGCLDIDMVHRLQHGHRLREERHGIARDPKACFERDVLPHATRPLSTTQHSENMQPPSDIRCSGHARRKCTVESVCHVHALQISKAAPARTRPLTLEASCNWCIIQQVPQNNHPKAAARLHLSGTQRQLTMVMRCMMFCASTAVPGGSTPSFPASSRAASTVVSNFFLCRASGIRQADLVASV